MSGSVGGYNYEDYVDNWTGNTVENPTLPTGSVGDHAFGVPQADGTWYSPYSVVPTTDTQGGGLAIGGWNASQDGWPGSAANPPGDAPSWWHDGSTNGMYYILTTPDATIVPHTNPSITGAQARANFIQSIVGAAQGYGYTSVLMDFEWYGSVCNPPTPYQPDPNIYTLFLQTLETALVPIKLEMPISPWAYNQRFYDLSTLVQSTNIIFQPMCFDYAMGQIPDTQGKVPVESNADVSTTMVYLNKMIAAGVPASRMMVGVPGYGVAYNCTPGVTPEALLAALDAGTLRGSYWTQQPAAQDGAGQMRNDTIMQNIGSWDKLNSGWTKVQDNKNPPDTWYYNSGTGMLINGWPPETIQNFANAIKASPALSGVNGFFEWEAEGDTTTPNGGTLNTLMQDMAYAEIIANLTAEQGFLTVGSPAYNLYATMIADFKAGEAGNYPIQYLQMYMTLASQGEISGTVGLTLYSEYQALQASGGTALSTFNTNCGVNNITPITSVTDLISVLTDISQAGTVSDNAGLLKMAQDLQALSSETVSQAMANSMIQADLQSLSSNVQAAVRKMTTS